MYIKHGKIHIVPLFHYPTRKKMEQYFETLTVRVKNVIITGDLRLFCKESW